MAFKATLATVQISKMTTCRYHRPHFYSVPFNVDINMKLINFASSLPIRERTGKPPPWLSPRTYSLYFVKWTRTGNRCGRSAASEFHEHLKLLFSSFFIFLYQCQSAIQRSDNASPVGNDLSKLTMAPQYGSGIQRGDAIVSRSDDSVLISVTALC